jgi:hypothetical protein
MSGAHGYGFVPFSVETYGRLGQPAKKLLHSLGDEAAGPGGVTRASFVNAGLRELSVDLCRGNFSAYRASVGMLARSSGASFGLACGCLQMNVWSNVLGYLLVMFCLPVLVLSVSNF